MRFRVQPRCVPRDVAARRMGLTREQFMAMEPDLRRRGFPYPDDVTGNYDLVAIDAWLDRKAGLAKPIGARDADDGFEQRLAQIG